MPVPTQPHRRVAVIGAGISGLSAAWLLSARHAVTLYEQAPRLGGHANTVETKIGGMATPVDTGFIVYNELNYPNLTALFRQLGVETRASDMSFAVSLAGQGVEYSSNDVSAFIGGGRNLLRPRFWTMMLDVLRFYREAVDDLRDAPDDLTLGDYLSAHKYSAAFQHDHLLPEAAAIWSSSIADMREYPARAFIRFFENHGLLKLSGRPAWRTVVGGSQAYVAALRAAMNVEVRSGCAVRAVTATPTGVEVRDASGDLAQYDRVLIATHSDQALAILANPDPDQRAVLSAIAYRPNTAVLHTDAALMPRRRQTWSSWNYVGDARVSGAGCAVTYWMNRLQGFETAEPLFVTLNPATAPAPERVLWEGVYEHPCFTPAALAAQKRLPRIQGRGNIWYAGAWAGAGFHEDGLSAGLAAAEAMGDVRRPWLPQTPAPAPKELAPAK